MLSAGSVDLRGWLRSSFFEHHIKRYSKSRRKAPIYWQLATPSASYSVWLYIHAFSKDTLLPRPERLRRAEARARGASARVSCERRATTPPPQRKEIAAQEAFVEELRALPRRGEARRAALEPEPRRRRRHQLRAALAARAAAQVLAEGAEATWDELAAGKYDWAHLAMHLWPERVVPKCATDRSLAIAHGLEDVFWVEGTDGKWQQRRAHAHRRRARARADLARREVRAEEPARGARCGEQRTRAWPAQRYGCRNRRERLMHPLHDYVAKQLADD